MTVFRGRRSHHLHITICNPITGMTFIDFDYEWGEDVGWDYECPKCGHDNCIELDDVKTGWFGKRMHVRCDSCNKKLPFEVDAEDAD